MQHPSQLEMFKLAVERAVVSNIYYHAMYPNGDGDISRDAVLAENIAKLASDLTPNHRALRIERNFHYEAPWPSAQAELKQVRRFFAFCTERNFITFLMSPFSACSI